MERKEFLKSLGAGAAFALTFQCLGGCSGGDDSEGNVVEQPDNVDFTVDLDDPKASALANNGGYILVKSTANISFNDVVVARNLEGDLIAATTVCSHENYDQVRFVPTEGGIFFCDVHGSKFDQGGAPLNSVQNTTAKPIKVYNTSLDGNLLRIFE
ncbi:ubiquinol-cytochrome c reductase iron-sulfur subunit [Maribacter sp. 2307ULW6-5]|uniref:QcrA and Rieske domain-containing protein n=1 Tax=Maribacter sp. 2307ULW6-5 TaxID=3386275 RepID=UPI0039BD8159